MGAFISSIIKVLVIKFAHPRFVPFVAKWLVFAWPKIPAEFKSAHFMEAATGGLRIRNEGGGGRMPRLLVHTNDDAVAKHMEGHGIDVVEIDPETKTADFCWNQGYDKHGNSIPEAGLHCGTIYDFYPRCKGITYEKVRVDNGNWHWTDARVILEDEEQFDLDYWTPRGRVEMEMPNQGKKHHLRVPALWVMEISPDTADWDCRDRWESDDFKDPNKWLKHDLSHLTPEEKAMFRKLDEECRKTGNCQPSPVARRNEADLQDRSVAFPALDSHFSALPLITASTSEHDYASKGADLIHTYLPVNDTMAQMDTLDFVMSTILKNAQSADLNKRMWAIPRAEAHVAMHAVLDAMIAKAANRRQKWALSAMGIGSIARVGREYVEAGGRDPGALYAVSGVFKRLFNDEAIASLNTTKEYIDKAHDRKAHIGKERKQWSQS